MTKLGSSQGTKIVQHTQANQRDTPHQQKGKTKTTWPFQ